MKNINTLLKSIRPSWQLSENPFQCCKNCFLNIESGYHYQIITLLYFRHVLLYDCSQPSPGLIPVHSIADFFRGYNAKTVICQLIGSDKNNDISGMYFLAVLVYKVVVCPVADPVLFLKHSVSFKVLSSPACAYKSERRGRKSSLLFNVPDNHLPGPSGFAWLRAACKENKRPLYKRPMQKVPFFLFSFSLPALFCRRR
jgi:hypothetical protein